MNLANGKLPTAFEQVIENPNEIGNIYQWINF